MKIWQNLVFDYYQYSLAHASLCLQVIEGKWDVVSLYGVPPQKGGLSSADSAGENYFL